MAVERADRTGALGGLGRALSATREALRTVVANPALRRVQLALIGSALGDWAYATAVTVWAYSAGGATAVGVFLGVRFLAVAVASPLGAVVADRVPRRTFMMVLDGTRALLVLAATACLLLGAPSLAVYGLALLTSVVGAPFRAAQSGLVPKLARTPEELTSSNATAGTLENAASFLGPALGGLLIAVSSVEVVFALNAATFLWSLLLVSQVHVSREDDSTGSDDAATGADPAADEDAPGFAAEVSAGFRTIAGDRDLVAVSLLAAVQGLVWGALSVVLVTLSLRLLHAGAAGVGYLNSTMGVATIVGGGVVLSRVRKNRLGQDMAVGVLGWALPLFLVAIAPSPVVLFAALLVIGLSDPLVNLGLDTIPQRIVPDRVLSRVFGALDTALVGAMALGAFVAPLLLSGLGLRGALVAVAVVPTLVVVASYRRMSRLDQRLAPPPGLPLIAGLDMFAPLGQATQESLAHALTTRVAAPGEVVVREGDPADGFFIIESGLVEVTRGDRVLRREAAGDFFGEIGLLRDVPRTATVTAVEDTVLRELDRGRFLAAVTGQEEARRAADDIASRRLAV